MIRFVFLLYIERPFVGFFAGKRAVLRKSEQKEAKRNKRRAESMNT